VEGDAQVALRQGRDLEGPPGRPAVGDLIQPLDGPGESRSLRFYLTTGAILAGLGFLATVAQLPMWSESPTLATVNVCTSVTFILTGLLLHREPGQRGVALALILAGVFRSLDFVDAWNGGPWAAYAVVFGAADRFFGAWALLRYPRPRLKTMYRVYLAVLAAWMLAGRMLVVVTSTAVSNGYPASSWWPTLALDLRLSNAAEFVLNCGQGVLGIVLLAFLIARLLDTKGLDRIVIAPIIAAGIAAVIAASASAVAQLFASVATGPTAAYVAEGLVDVTVPLAFLVAVVQRALLVRNLAGLSARISRDSDLGSVRYALRETLHDPTLEVLDVSDSDNPAGGLPASGLPAAGLPAAGLPAAGLPAGTGAAGGAADRGGRLVAGGSPGTSAAGGSLAGTSLAGGSLAGGQAGSRLVEVIKTDAGAPIAVVIADPALARYRGLFDAAVRTSGLALKNAQLQAQAARAELEHVRASRARIVEAALTERRRLERDLHDGAQQHLLGLAAALTAAMARTTDPEATAAFRTARAQLGQVLAELRDLAHGIHPAALAQGGLAAALEEVAERLPLAIELTVPPDRVAPDVEATAYFVACEALTNAVKHARAASAAVTVRFTGDRLEMEVSDDGAGGADPEGRGFANIMDRVSALDGDTVVESPPGEGTRILVRIPCA
jgi:signal transduction histidine kinase